MINRKVILPIFFAVLVAIDVFSKVVVQAKMSLYESVEIISGFFNITYVLNPGAAFGIFRNQPELFRKFFFIVVALLAIVLILIIIKREFSHRLRTYAYTMVLAGAGGNLIDRIHTGVVVDFLDFYYKNFHWYTFNVADICITCGVGLLIIDLFVNKQK